MSGAVPGAHTESTSGSRSTLTRAGHAGRHRGGGRLGTRSRAFAARRVLRSLPLLHRKMWTHLPKGRLSRYIHDMVSADGADAEDANHESPRAQRLRKRSRRLKRAAVIFAVITLVLVALSVTATAGSGPGTCRRPPCVSASPTGGEIWVAVSAIGTGLAGVGTMIGGLATARMAARVTRPQPEGRRSAKGPGKRSKGSPP